MALTLTEDVRPYAARWTEIVESPSGSTNMANPDTSTYNKNTEDNDT